MFQKILKKSVSVHKICIYILQKFQVKFFNEQWETKKTNLAWIVSLVSQKDKNNPLFKLDLSFSFLGAHFDFWPENFRACRNISCEHSKIFVDFFKRFKMIIFNGTTWSTYIGGSTRYSLRWIRFVVFSIFLQVLTRSAGVAVFRDLKSVV